jgi:hypothetical protein
MILLLLPLPRNETKYFDFSLSKFIIRAETLQFQYPGSLMSAGCLVRCFFVHKFIVKPNFSWLIDPCNLSCTSNISVLTVICISRETNFIMFVFDDREPMNHYFLTLRSDPRNTYWLLPRNNETLTVFIWVCKISYDFPDLLSSYLPSHCQSPGGCSVTV